MGSKHYPVCLYSKTTGLAGLTGITGGAKDKGTSVPALLLKTARSAQTLPGGGGEN